MLKKFFVTPEDVPAQEVLMLWAKRNVNEVFQCEPEKERLAYNPHTVAPLHLNSGVFYIIPISPSNLTTIYLEIRLCIDAAVLVFPLIVSTFLKLPSS